MEGNSLSTFYLVIFVVFLFCNFLSRDEFYSEICVAVECVLSYPPGKSARGAEVLLHPGVDALVKM